MDNKDSLIFVLICCILIVFTCNIINTITFYKVSKQIFILKEENNILADMLKNKYYETNELKDKLNSWAFNRTVTYVDNNSVPKANCMIAPCGRTLCDIPEIKPIEPYKEHDYIWITPNNKINLNSTNNDTMPYWYDCWWSPSGKMICDKIDIRPIEPIIMHNFTVPNGTIFFNPNNIKTINMTSEDFFEALKGHCNISDPMSPCM